MHFIRQCTAKIHAEDLKIFRGLNYMELNNKYQNFETITVQFSHKSEANW